LAQWNLLNRLKKKEKEQTDKKLTTEELQESEEKQIKPETREETKEVPIKVYNETLYSKGFAQKQSKTPYPEEKQPLKRTSWENSETIEHTVDSMRPKQTESTANSTQKKDDTDKKVDFILLKKKRQL
jgi:hypothetical protein